MQKAYSNKDFRGLISPAIMLISLLGTFRPVLQKLALRWNSGDDSYCFLIMPLFAYLCWQKRDSFRFAEFSWSPWGLLSALLAVALIAAGELAAVESLLYLGFWACIFSVFVLLYGRRVSRLGFAFLILLFIMPLPPFINRLLTFNLKMAASSVAVQLLRLAGLQVLQEGNIIDLGGLDKLQMVDACSGLRYVMPMLLTALLIGHLFSRGWWRQSILILLILPLSVVINAGRIFLTGLLTAKGHQELAQDLFHDAAGLVIFLVAGALLLAAARLLKKIGPAPPRPNEPDSGGRPVSPAGAATLVGLVAALFLGGGWLLQQIPALQTQVTRSSFDSFPMEIADWQGERHYLEPEILNALWADDYLSATFTRADRPNRIYLLIPYYDYQGTRHTAHAPQSCLLGSGWAILASRNRRLPVAGSAFIPVRTIMLGKGNARMLANYFFLQRGRVITSPWLNKFYLLWDALTRRRTDGALVRVEMSMTPDQREEQALALLDGFLAALWPRLPEYVPE